MLGLGLGLPGTSGMDDLEVCDNGTGAIETVLLDAVVEIAGSTVDIDESLATSDPVVGTVLVAQFSTNGVATVCDL